MIKYVFIINLVYALLNFRTVLIAYLAGEEVNKTTTTVQAWRAL